MDYKFIIILIVLVGLIFVIVNGMSRIDGKLDAAEEKARRSIVTLDQKMQAGFNTCVDKIRIINGRYMVDIRKMNEIEGQAIVPSASNGYTETESVKKSNPEKIMHLTEVDDGPKKQKPSANSQFEVHYSAKKESEKEIAKHNTEKETAVPTPAAVATATESIDGNEADEADCDDGDEADGDESSSSSSAASSIAVDSQLVNEKPNDAGDDDVGDDIAEDESMVTADVIVTLDTFKPIEEYTCPHLFNIARRLMIPIYVKNGNVRSRVKKDEVYNRIKEKLTSS